MPYKKLFTLVTLALMMSSKAGAQQSLTISELRAIESLINQKDCGELYAYLSANPHTIAGGDSLARELQIFIRDVERGSLDCFSASITNRAAVAPPSGTDALAAAADNRQQY